ncbi:MAG: SRPBCC family protein [Haloarculaceae archaeon]
MRLARTTDGRRLDVTRRIDADPDRVWSVFTDTELWPEWGSSVTAVECADRFVREGSTGRVRTPVGLWLPFTVRTCTDRRWTWDVVGVPATGHRVEAAGDGSKRSREEVVVVDDRTRAQPSRSDSEPGRGERYRVGATVKSPTGRRSSPMPEPSHSSFGHR